MEKLEKFLTVGVTADNKCGINITPNTTLADALQLIGTLSKHVLNAYTKVAEADIDSFNNKKLNALAKQSAKKGIRNSIYDAANTVFSTILGDYNPEAAKLSIEDEAIIELTNKKIEEKYNSLSEEEKEAYSKGYNTIRKHLENANKDSKRS